MLDALHLASALENQAELFVSNDAELRRVKELRVVILSDYLTTG
jgi:predicted nucleic acid-binding protein